ncbi:MAG TPA: Kdo hydroxylase family protein [Caulobacteraceae bacterium]
MAIIYKHPELKDYFARVGVRATVPTSQIASIIKPYELGQVIHLPNLDLKIDHAFWAGLQTDQIVRLKKLSSSPSLGDPSHDRLLDRRLADASVPGGLKRRLKKEIVRLYERVLPVYEALFSGYRFTRRQVVWRLNTIRNENLHVDTYLSAPTDHFARLFINLDDQPRIWMTSWTLEEMYERFGERIPREVLSRGDPGEVHAAVNAAAFGGRSTMWWDNQPRHIAYFDPGDVWAVDSRQISHQIFYGRRAVSIDFFVDPESMLKRKRHYLRTADRFRISRLADERAGRGPPHHFV